MGLGRFAVVACAVVGAAVVVPAHAADAPVTHPLVTDAVGDVPDGSAPSLDVVTGDVHLAGNDVVAVLGLADLSDRPDRKPIGVVQHEVEVYRADLSYSHGAFELTATRSLWNDQVKASGRWTREGVSITVTGVRTSIDDAAGTVTLRASLDAMNAALDTDFTYSYAPFVRGSAVVPTFVASASEYLGTSDQALVGLADRPDEAFRTEPGFYYRLGT